MSKIVVFGAGKIADVAYYYLTNDSPHEIVAFTVDGAYLTKRDMFSRPVVPFEDVEEVAILGSPQFLDFLRESKTHKSELIKEIPRSERIVNRPTLQDLFGEVGDLEERDRMIVFAKKRCGYLNTEIARFLGLDESTVSKIVGGTYNK